MTRATYTYTMEVSPAAFAEIRDKLIAAGYKDRIHDRGKTLDLHGIALQTVPTAPKVLSLDELARDPRLIDGLDFETHRDLMRRAATLGAHLAYALPEAPRALPSAPAAPAFPAPAQHGAEPERPELLTTGEVAAILRVHRSTVYNAVSTDSLGPDDGVIQPSRHVTRFVREVFMARLAEGKIHLGRKNREGQWDD
jgi:hypothetical protein